MAKMSAAETAGALVKKGKKWGGERWSSMEGGRKADRLETGLIVGVIAICIGLLIELLRRD